MLNICLNADWGWISDTDGGYNDSHYLGTYNFFWGISPLGIRNDSRLYIFYMGYQIGGHGHDYDAFVFQSDGGVRVIVSLVTGTVFAADGDRTVLNLYQVVAV